jgi:protein LSM14
MSDLRVNGGSTGPITSYRGGRGGGRRGRGGRIGDGGSDQIRVPTTDYDFESANAKFDKTAVAKAAKSPDEDSTSEDSVVLPAEPSAKGAYNPKASFFDSLSSSASLSAERGGGRGRRGGGGVSGGRTRRDEEREKNFVTFGETGAAGLLGRGEHVVGWNGYGRRGGGRPRRGTPRGGTNAQAAAARG